MGDEIRGVEVGLTNVGDGTISLGDRDGDRVRGEGAAVEAVDLRIVV